MRLLVLITTLFITIVFNIVLSNIRELFADEIATTVIPPAVRHLGLSDKAFAPADYGISSKVVLAKGEVLVHKSEVRDTPSNLGGGMNTSTPKTTCFRTKQIVSTEGNGTNGYISDSTFHAALVQRFKDVSKLSQLPMNVTLTDEKINTLRTLAMRAACYHINGTNPVKGYKKWENSSFSTSTNALITGLGENVKTQIFTFRMRKRPILQECHVLIACSALVRRIMKLNAVPGALPFIPTHIGFELRHATESDYYVLGLAMAMAPI